MEGDWRYEICRYLSHMILPTKKKKKWERALCFVLLDENL